MIDAKAYFNTTKKGPNYLSCNPFSRYPKKQYALLHLVLMLSELEDAQ